MMFYSIGMAFGSLSLWLWLAAGLASFVGLLSVCSLLSWLSHLPERMPKMRESLTLRRGESVYLQPTPKESMALKIGKMMALGALILGAYDVGTQSRYSKEYAAWKARSAEYQQLYAAWAARQPKETK